MSALKHYIYLGDSVYAQYDGYGIILFTNNGKLNIDKTRVQKNPIYLEPDLITKLANFLQQQEQNKNNNMNHLSITNGLVPEDLNSLLKNIDLILTFLNNHPGLSEAYYAIGIETYLTKPLLVLNDPALVGHILGTAGWTRELEYSIYSWYKSYPDYGIRVKINNAEIFEIQSDVRPNQFPLMLADSDLSSVPSSAHSTVTDCEQI